MVPLGCPVSRNCFAAKVAHKMSSAGPCTSPKLAALLATTSLCIRSPPPSTHHLRTFPLYVTNSTCAAHQPPGERFSQPSELAHYGARDVHGGGGVLFQQALRACTLCTRLYTLYWVGMSEGSEGSEGSHLVATPHISRRLQSEDANGHGPVPARGLHKLLAAAPIPHLLHADIQPLIPLFTTCALLAFVVLGGRDAAHLQGVLGVDPDGDEPVPVGREGHSHHRLPRRVT
eukprot:4377617-Pyramimonas_sp.AAC.1